MANQRKRLILCCDGTWMDSDNGFQKPTLIPYVPTGSLVIPSNVTRISRALKRNGSDGMPQIIYYHAGVGTGSSWIDTITGGLLGTGISEHIREVYSFIAANWLPGDEIILIGFSRGAFTARSVAGMIAAIGVLTRKGMYDFYAIFKDQENSRNLEYKDQLPHIPFSNKPKPGPNAEAEYRARLLKKGLTRVDLGDAARTPIRIKAVAVWDTVGSLGIPQISILSRLGLPHSTKEYKFNDTKISSIVENAFQALALDEHRKPFSPAVWERDLTTTTDLRQVWFAGAHSNVGGGYADQEIANISIAWMMDQLASVGLAFRDRSVKEMFEDNVKYYEDPPIEASSCFERPTTQRWAVRSIYDRYQPVRPWSLGEIYNSDTGIYFLTGKINRTPGLYKRADPSTGLPTSVPIAHTNERIHSSVRERLHLGGLGLDDKHLYDCPALLENGPWKLKQIEMNVLDPIPQNASWGPGTDNGSIEKDNKMRWVWEYAGPKADAPVQTLLVEETLGPFERMLKNLGRHEI